MRSVIRETVEVMLERINAISAPGPGFTRPSYSDLETRAHGIVAEHADRLGLTVTRDAACNLFARVPGRDRTATPLFVGSHLDSVAQGGAYDGTAGVAGAMALAAALISSGEPPRADVVVTVTRAEESVWFPVSYIGSRAALARLDAADLAAKRSDTGRTLAEHMREQGGNPDAVMRGSGLSQARFVELHIEQGPVLQEAGEPFAVVEAVRGGIRYREAAVLGTWAHSGGAPRHARSDAVFALADLITGMDRAWEETLRAGHDIAVTFGRVDAATSEHAFAKVPGHAGFCVDLRSGDTQVLDRADIQLKELVADIERRRGVRFALGPQSRSRPSPLSSRLAGDISAAARSRGFSPRTMLSGGGHDAAAFAQAGWEASMIFVRNWNGSHNPDEGMDPADLEDAVDTLFAMLMGANSA